MKANEFVRKYGLDEATAFLSMDSDVEIVYTESFFDDLKRIVESHELVEKYKNRHGGIRFRIRWGQFRYGDTKEYNDRLKQAIIDVESCMEVSSESN